MSKIGDLLQQLVFFSGQDQMEVLRKQNERMNKQVADLTAENKKLVLPLKQALDDVREYKRQLQNYEKDKISLAVAIFLQKS